jgi:hypothetical protein
VLVVVEQEVVVQLVKQQEQLILAVEEVELDQVKQEKLVVVV